MAEYRFHWWSSRAEAKAMPSVEIEAASPLAGAALALRHFRQEGYDIDAPLAHVDLVGPAGAKRMLLIDEVREWLHDPKQAIFVRDQDLGDLVR